MRQLRTRQKISKIIYLVEENDTRGVLPSLSKEIADASRTYTAIDLNEVGARHAVEGNARLASHGLGEQSLT